MTEEIWKDIPGYEGYQASDQGRIRSLDRYLPCTNKAGTWHQRLVKGHLIKLQKHPEGYLSVVLGGKSSLVHTLVAHTFIGERPDGYEVAHNDGCKKNNTLINLRYSTPADNAADRDTHGTSLRGEKQSKAKLKEYEVREIRSLAWAIDQYTLATMFGVTQPTIWKIIHRLRWTHI